MPFRTVGYRRIQCSICFMDGSCLGNSGPCGAGFCFSFLIHLILFAYKRHVSKHSSILLGEFMVIQSTITFIQNYIKNKLDISHQKSTKSPHCMACRCSPLRRKFTECCITNLALSLLMKHLLIGQRQKAPNFSAFH